MSEENYDWPPYRVKREIQRLQAECDRLRKLAYSPHLNEEGANISWKYLHADVDQNRIALEAQLEEVNRELEIASRSSTALRQRLAERDARIAEQQEVIKAWQDRFGRGPVSGQ